GMPAASNVRCSSARVTRFADTLTVAPAGVAVLEAPTGVVATDWPPVLVAGAVDEFAPEAAADAGVGTLVAAALEAEDAGDVPVEALAPAGTLVTLPQAPSSRVTARA